MSDAASPMLLVARYTTGPGHCDLVVRRRPEDGGGTVPVSQIIRFDSMGRRVMSTRALSREEALALARDVCRQKVDPRDPSVPVRLAAALLAMDSRMLERADAALAAEAEGD